MDVLESAASPSCAKPADCSGLLPSARHAEDERHTDRQRRGERTEAAEIGCSLMSSQAFESGMSGLKAVSVMAKTAAPAWEARAASAGVIELYGLKLIARGGIPPGGGADLLEPQRPDIIDEAVPDAELGQGERHIEGDRKGALATDDMDRLRRRQS